MREKQDNRRSSLIAAVWGLAESTLFFIVPDVWLTRMALKGMRPGLVACVWAIAGALVGGSLMYAWGEQAPASALAWMDRVPAVSVDLIERVRSGLERQGAMAALVGSFVGRPYKVYAVQAGSLDLGLWTFLLFSIPARAARFVLGVVFTRVVLATVGRGWSDETALRVLLGFWVVFYVGFFAWMPN